MKILVTQYYTENIKYGKLSEELNKKYCEKYQYDYFVEKDTEELNKIFRDENIAPQWYKVKLLKDLLDKSDEYDWILFLDADAIFSNENVKIEDFIDEQYNLILADDMAFHSIVNTGVILVKNSEWSKKFLNDWWNSKDSINGKDALEILNWNGGGHALDNNSVFKSALWHEQTCISILYKTNEDVAKNIKVVNKEDLNSPIYRPDGFIFHAFGYGHSQLRDIDLIHEAKTFVKEDKEKIIIVYFVYCINQYLDIAKKDLERIKSSGLYDTCDNIFVVASLPNNSEEEYNQLLELYKECEKIKIEKRYGNRFEHYGICRAWIEAHKSDGVLLYFHAKGVADLPLFNNPHSEWKAKGTSSFVEMLKYFMIDKYQNCLEKLNEYDQVNTSDSYSRGWPSGNFWWCKMDYLRNSNFPYESIWDRWASEAWINFRSKKYTTYQMYDRFYFRDKFTYIPEASYKNPNSMKDKEINLLSAKYMVLLEPENENDRNRPSETYEVDCTDFVRENLNNNEKKGFSNIVVSHSGTLGPNVIEDPIYGIKKVLVVEFTITDDQTIYRLVVDEGDALDYKIDSYKSIGYEFVYPNKTILELKTVKK